MPSTSEALHPLPIPVLRRAPRAARAWSPGTIPVPNRWSARFYCLPEEFARRDATTGSCPLNTPFVTTAPRGLRQRPDLPFRQGSSPRSNERENGFPTSGRDAVANSVFPFTAPCALLCARGDAGRTIAHSPDKKFHVFLRRVARRHLELSSDDLVRPDKVGTPSARRNLRSEST